MFAGHDFNANKSNLFVVSAEIRQIEGTILLYVGNAMKQNQFLGKSFLKMLKVGLLAFQLYDYCCIFQCYTVCACF